MTIKTITIEEAGPTLFLLLYADGTYYISTLSKSDLTALITSRTNILYTD
jgi:hypothetical protein